MTDWPSSTHTKKIIEGEIGNIMRTVDLLNSQIETASRIFRMPPDHPVAQLLEGLRHNSTHMRQVIDMFGEKYGGDQS